MEDAKDSSSGDFKEGPVANGVSVHEVMAEPCDLPVTDAQVTYQDSAMFQEQIDSDRSRLKSSR